jgi:hypothetical protein
MTGSLLLTIGSVPGAASERCLGIACRATVQGKQLAPAHGLVALVSMLATVFESHQMAVQTSSLAFANFLHRPVPAGARALCYRVSLEYG